MFAMEKTFEWSEDGKVLLKLLDNGVKEVVVPDGVVTIGDEAFKKCSSLQSISLPDSLTTIGEKAFCKVSIFLQVLSPLVCRHLSLVILCKPSVSAIGTSGDAR